jgi:hypothetical protein
MASGLTGLPQQVRVRLGEKAHFRPRTRSVGPPKNRNFDFKGELRPERRQVAKLLNKRTIRRYLEPQDALHESLSVYLWRAYNRLIKGDYDKLLIPKDLERLRTLLFGSVFQSPMFHRDLYPTAADFQKMKDTYDQVEAILKNLPGRKISRN